MLIRIDPEPVHDAPHADFIRSDRRDVVFRLACNDAGVAADAGPRIDHHRPSIRVAGERRRRSVEARLGRGRRNGFSRPKKRGELLRLPGEREQAGGRRWELSVGPRAAQLRAAGDPGRSAVPQNGSVEADVIADRAGALSAVAQRQPQHAGRETGRKTHRPGDNPAVCDDRRFVAFRDLRAGGILGRHLDRVAPHGLREGLGTFLKPGVVRKPSVIDGRIGAIHDCIPVLSPWRRPVGKSRCGGFRDGLLGGALDDPLDQRLAPAILEALAAPAPSPKLAQAVVITPIGFAIHQREQSVRAAGGMERADQRLDEADRSVGSRDVRPGFERVWRG